MEPPNKIAVQTTCLAGGQIPDRVCRINNPRRPCLERVWEKTWKSICSEKTWKAANVNINHQNFAANFVGAGQDSAVRGGASWLGIGGGSGGGPLLKCGGGRRGTARGRGRGRRGAGGGAG